MVSLLSGLILGYSSELSEFRGNELHDGVLRYNNIPNKDVVNREATDRIMTILNPAFIFSGHSHYSCLYSHPNGISPLFILYNADCSCAGVREFTVSTFNWRNRLDPSFVLATVHSTKRMYAFETVELKYNASFVQMSDGRVVRFTMR